MKQSQSSTRCSAPSAAVIGRRFDRLARRRAAHVLRTGRPDYRLVMILRDLRARIRRQRQGGAS